MKCPGDLFAPDGTLQALLRLATSDKLAIKFSFTQLPRSLKTLQKRAYNYRQFTHYKNRMHP
jgi:hypothetical protein